MTFDILTHNADLLWNNPNDNFYVNHSGKLNSIPKWDLIGRLIKYIKNWHGKVTEKVSLAVLKTLQDIANHNESEHKKLFKAVNLFYVRYKGSDFGSLFFDSGRAYSPHYPAYHLAEKIQNTIKFNKILGLVDICDQLKQQKPFYPDSNERKQIVMGPIYPDPKILYFDERKAMS